MPPPNPVPNFYQRAGRAVQGGGMPGVLTSLQRMQQQAERTKDTVESLDAALELPAVMQAAGEVAAMANATRDLNSQIRQRVELEARRAAVTSGQYGRDLQANQRIHREQQRVYELERRAQYQNRFGRVGGYLAHQVDMAGRDRGVRTALGVAGGIATAGAGLAMNGFQGTVELNRFNLEIKLISRELAGALKPALEFVTGGLQKFRKWLERLSPEGQDRIMAGLVVGGGLATAGLAKAGLGALGVGSLFRGALAAAPAAAAAAPGVGAATAGGAAVGAAARGGARAGIARFLGPVGVAAGAMTIMAETSGDRLHKDEGVSDYYARKRAEGRSVLGALWETGGTGVAALGREVFGGKEKFVGDPDKERADRRRVTIADSGFDEIGTAKMRMTNSLAMVTAAERDGKEGGGAVAGLLTEILKRIDGAAGVMKAAPKPPLPGR